MYRYKKSVDIEYNRQGAIYFVSRLYAELPEESKKTIRHICEVAGDDHADALMEFVTTDRSATSICMRFYISRSSLYRLVRRYYHEFPDIEICSTP